MAGCWMLGVADACAGVSVRVCGRESNGKV